MHLPRILFALLSAAALSAPLLGCMDLDAHGGCWPNGCEDATADTGTFVDSSNLDETADASGVADATDEDGLDSSRPDSGGDTDAGEDGGAAIDSSDGSAVTDGADGGTDSAAMDSADAADACVPLATCPAGRICGSYPDGCGGTINCGICGSGTICDPASNTCSVCAPSTATCVGKDLRTCNSTGSGFTTETCLACTGTTCLRGLDISSNSGQHTCALLSDGTVRCWGDYQNSATGSTSPTLKPTPITGVASATAVATGPYSSGVVLASGSAQWWGVIVKATDGSITTTTSPTTIGGLSNVSQLALAQQHGCARSTDGSLRCWGIGDKGQIGDGAGVTRPTPVLLSSITGTFRISLGGYQSFAILSSDARAWGYNRFGSLGNGFTTIQWTPTTVFGAAAEIATEDEHTCVVLTTGDVRCVGHNSEGQLGDGTKVDSTAPVTVDLGGVAATQVGVGTFHSCALLTTGSVKCWGANYDGQLGDGTTSGSTKAVSVLGLSGVKKLVVGARHNCALLPNSVIKCWGVNNYGQIGDGTDAISVPKRLIPTAVVW